MKFKFWFVQMFIFFLTSSIFLNFCRKYVVCFLFFMCMLIAQLKQKKRKKENRIYLISKRFFNGKLTRSRTDLSLLDTSLHVLLKAVSVSNNPSLCKTWRLLLFFGLALATVLCVVSPVRDNFFLLPHALLFIPELNERRLLWPNSHAQRS